MMNWLSIIAGVAYIAMGVAVVIYKFFGVTLTPLTAYCFGGVMIVYGIFRIGRVIYKMRNEEDI